MELLLFILFLLFSMFSALMERRKRRKQVEEAQAQQEARRKRREEVEDEVEDEVVSTPQPLVVEEKNEEEEETSFVCPFEGDPFEDFRPATESEPAPELEGQGAERAALDAERRALDAERRALAMERMSLETGPKGGISERFHRAAVKRSAGPRVQLGRWRLDSRRARDAVVYMEILGKPKAERDDER